MNLGQAVAVCLYELVRDAKRAAAVPSKEKHANAGEIERISAALLETLHHSGYINPIAKAATEERVRRMLRRLDLSSHDAELWQGMLRQILWKVKSFN